MINKFNNEYRWLSNFWLSPIVIDDIQYASTEHYYQAMKTFDKSDRELIRNASVVECKQLGRKVKIRDDWDKSKDTIMLLASFQKFDNHPGLKQKLIDTEPHELIEGNWWHDNYWGDCYCEKCVDIKGENKLGKILMFVRRKYIKGS